MVKKLVYSHTATKRRNSNLGLADSKTQISFHYLPLVPICRVGFFHLFIYTQNIFINSFLSLKWTLRGTFIVTLMKCKLPAPHLQEFFPKP